MERDEIEELKRYYEAMNFNSRAHVERDLIQIRKLYFLTKISTHALMWSATKDRLKASELLAISTHALTWSATAYRF